MTILNASPTAVAIHLATMMASGIDAPWSCPHCLDAYLDRCIVYCERTKTQLSLARLLDDDCRLYVRLLLNGIENQQLTTPNVAAANEWRNRIFGLGVRASLETIWHDNYGYSTLEFRHLVGRVI